MTIYSTYGHSCTCNICTLFVCVSIYRLPPPPPSTEMYPPTDLPPPLWSKSSVNNSNSSLTPVHFPNDPHDF